MAYISIVPNAVLVNWKSELHSWLPNVACIYYVGNKDQRAKLFSQEVCHMRFNVLVTTYEFIMFDKSKLSRVDWNYIDFIDDAQRMKDRESVLAHDLDKYRCQRRLLLTGTPLQNDLKELWSLLNLLLLEVFDNHKVFHDWFSQPFQKEVSHNGEDDWLETKKKVIIIHRLHQILEPFMLKRRVKDVEGSLRPKISIILRCKMSAMQGAIYDWIKSTGTIRLDSEDEECKVQKSKLYQAKTFKPLNNKCMELRKTCNHLRLNYPYINNLSKYFLVKSCGKLWVLDRILVKLQRTGLIYRRIDGTTSLEDRESAIVDFNSPDTDCLSSCSVYMQLDKNTPHMMKGDSTLGKSLLRDEERYQQTVHDVPSLQEVNRMIARSEEEVELFD
ncbi:ATP-dependent helicase BRM isoform X1 [Tanacetum coccineum]